MKGKTQTERVRKRYSRIAGLYDLIEAPMERAFAGRRQELLAGVAGRVLEVGVGTGKKLLAGPLMDLINPLPLYLYGANINRHTLENLRTAGFTRIEEENLWDDIVKRIVARP